MITQRVAPSRAVVGMRAGRAIFTLGLAFLVLAGCGDVSDPTAPAQPARAKGTLASGRTQIVVHTEEELRAAIGLANVDVLAARGGSFVLRPCPVGVDETVDPSCGQLNQGSNSVLRSTLKLELDENGVPTGGVSKDGAVIDCGQLPPSALALSCLVPGDGSTVRNITIRNGDETPAPDPAGGDPAGPDNRNAIMIVPGQAAVVEEARLQNARRGVLLTAGNGQRTSGVVRSTLIDGTELAGVFLWALHPDHTSSFDAELDVSVSRTRLTRIGLHPLLIDCPFYGGGNRCTGSYQDNIVDSTNVFGISIVGGGDGAGDGNHVSFEASGGRLEGAVGVLVTTFGYPRNDHNRVTGALHGVTFANAGPSVLVNLARGWGTDNLYTLAFDGCAYDSGVRPGYFDVTDGSGSDFQIAGSPSEFTASNVNFDISNVLGEFADSE